MVSAPYSERRHRIHGDEIEPVKQAVYVELLRRLRERDDHLTTCTLFRFWYRIETHCRNKPRYPPHDDWDTLRAYLGLGYETPHLNQPDEVPQPFEKEVSHRLGGESGRPME